MDGRATVERIRQAFWYNKKTGELIWLVQSGSRSTPGQRAGSVRTDADGYRSRIITLDSGRYSASHIIWVWMTGEWPKRTIDHKNCDSLDDSWTNLREAGISEQKQNSRKRRDNRTGFKCVVYDKERDKYRWQVVVNGKRTKSAKRYETAEEAYADYCARLPDFHGDFANNGRTI